MNAAEKPGGAHPARDPAASSFYGTGNPAKIWSMISSLVFSSASAS
jgi:hypothetical protein